MENLLNPTLFAIALITISIVSGKIYHKISVQNDLKIIKKMREISTPRCY